MPDRLPLRVATTSPDPVVQALDEMDGRQHQRHVELTSGLLKIIGGLAGSLVAVTLAAVFTVGAVRGAPPEPTANAVVHTMSAGAAGGASQ